MKILVAIDPSDSTHIALSKAAELAKKEGAQLTLLAVAENVQDMESVFGAEASDRLRERAAKALSVGEAIAKAAGVKPQLLNEAGVSPEDIIVDVAQKGGFDLVVMGTRSKKGKTGLRMGSVASRVVAQAPCSVLVVR